MNKLELTDEQLLLVERALDFYSRSETPKNLYKRKSKHKNKDE